MLPIEELRGQRIQKLENFREKKINPYPSRSKRSDSIANLLSDFERLSLAKEEVFICGRIKSLRKHGKITFGNIQDESADIQFLLKEDILGKRAYKEFSDFDIGDFIQAKGMFFKTKTKEKTLEAHKYKILTKSLCPLPEKWKGLRDIELRQRKRYLDLVINEDTKRRFTQRSNFIKNFRNILEEKGFLEVETPVLEHTPGGADAEPFITHHNALNIDLYLRISLELHLKRLIAGGFEKIFEIGRVFRNEGISTTHLQEFTMCEFYAAYWDYEKMMRFIEDLYSDAAKRTFNQSLHYKFGDHEINFTPPWPRIDYSEIFASKIGTSLDKIPDKKSAVSLAKKLNVKIEPYMGRGRIIDQIYKKKIRANLIGPLFLVNHPVAVSPLAKRNERDSNLTERFQPIICGEEVGNGFSELNDPLDQRKRFEEQMKLREKGDKEAQMLDEGFLEALEYGMPPTAGFGVGIDRLFMMFTNMQNIREVVFFPTMRPKETKEKRQ